MKCYIISYDLVNQRDYESLHKAIKSYSGWAKITESTWAVKTDNTAKEIRDHLSEFLDQDDRVFVIKSGVEAAWRNSICKNEWLKNNL
jgi:hypothetical protein